MDLARPIPNGSFGLPNEVASAVAYLASDAISSFVTGSETMAEGGYTAR
ncbi:MAG: SDR family oxidoreductase [Pseudomonadota bacterium]